VAAQNQRVSVRSSYPSAAATWTAAAIVNTALSGGATTTVTPYAVCAA
jgi:hypothetical protein